EPLALKWQVLGYVPIVRFLPVIFALCAGAVSQILLWKIPFHEGVVVFFFQLVFTLGAMLALSIVFSLGLGIYERVAGPPAPQPAAKHPEETHGPGAEPANLHHLRQHIDKVGPEQDTLWRRLDARWESVNGHLRPLYDLLRPLTRHFPPPAQNFLDAG